MIDEVRLEALIDAYLDLELEEAGRLELEEMLIRSSRARQRFHERTTHHGLLREWALREEGNATVAGEITRSRSRWRPWAVGLAACGVGWLWWQPGVDRAESPVVVEKSESAVENVALLAAAVDVRWADDAKSYHMGQALPKGPLQLAGGLVRLDFYSGAKVFLEGPATLDLVSPDLARLESGRLTAQVPPPAHGFTVLSDEVQVVDRGTEFGMSVGDDQALQVHVFDGEVELHSADGVAPVRSLFGGGAVAIQDGSATDLPADRGAFANPGALLVATEEARQRGWQQWQSTSERIRLAAGLKIYYDFRIHPRGVIPNLAGAAPAESDGTLIGCEAVPGRWPQKPALGFARTSDRVRFWLEGEVPSVTMMARVRVDSLPHDHNALLSMTPGEQGEIHWKLDREGRLLLGLRASSERAFESWERLVSPPVVAESDLGHWMVLATVIDGDAGEMRHFVDGRLVAEAAISRPTLVKLGKANLGNFDAASPDLSGAEVTRNFNGRFEEFAFFDRALSEEEIGAWGRGE
ncbi:hypothetical protein HNR46_003131 [Haloferula luteola]|uniref:FecR protein domain-containing protein n=1 Tax=Haloferula luteola TaxID=595692 RepID=A0A840V4H4_9BACT|nr:LamG-like jellyroll fold domain-containing protein [Haloferula luteola]MBB5352882.1 hypothetical protein [Haloferula luteola]